MCSYITLHSGVPSPSTYDAYVNSTTAPGVNVLYYDSGNTTLDGTLWYVGISYVDTATVVVQDHGFESSSTQHVDAVYNDATIQLQSTFNHHHTIHSTNKQHNAKGRITAFDSRDTTDRASTSTQYSVQDWTAGAVAAIFSGDSCINNCSYSVNGGNGQCTAAHSCVCTNGWASPDCSQFNPPSPHILTNVEKIVLPIVACVGSILLGVLLCVCLRRRRYRGYTGLNENGSAPGFGGIGYALGSGLQVNQSVPTRSRPAVSTPAAAAPPSNTTTQPRSNIQAGASQSGGSRQQTGTRLGVLYIMYYIFCYYCIYTVTAL